MLYLGYSCDHLTKAFIKQTIPLKIEFLLKA